MMPKSQIVEWRGYTIRYLVKVVDGLPEPFLNHRDVCRALDVPVESDDDAMAQLNRLCLTRRNDMRSLMKSALAQLALRAGA